jgi:hypothetical protein
VAGYGGRQDYAVANGSGLRKLEPAAAPVSTALGVLGMPGMTAYTGLLEIGRPRAGETVAVAAASGAVGATGTVRSCQGAAAREWIAARAAELLPVPYFHVVFTLPSAIGDIAYPNKVVIYDLLFAASTETTLSSRPIPSISAPASASPRSCTPGGRR